LEKSGAISFTYDEFANLLSEEAADGNRSYRYEYNYEEGKGNYRDFLLPGGRLIQYDFYPSPTRSYHSLTLNPALFKRNR
jgi:YD repeat-containing protein